MSQHTTLKHIIDNSSILIEFIPYVKFFSQKHGSLREYSLRSVSKGPIDGKYTATLVDVKTQEEYPALLFPAVIFELRGAPKQ